MQVCTSGVNDVIGTTTAHGGVYRSPHTTQTQSSSQMPLSDHSVASRLTRSAEKLDLTWCFDMLPTPQQCVRSVLARDAISGWRYSRAHKAFLPHTPLNCLNTANQNGNTASTQPENPMALTETSHVELEQATSAQFQKLPTQLNTPKRFVPELVRVSPNTNPTSCGLASMFLP